MKFITDRKRALGLGAAGHGADAHWKMLVGSIAVCILVPLFVFTFGAGYGRSHEEVVAFFGRPFPAILTALTLYCVITHILRETVEAIEDYMGGIPRKLTIIAVTAFCYTLIVAGLFALVKLAL